MANLYNNISSIFSTVEAIRENFEWVSQIQLPAIEAFEDLKKAFNYSKVYSFGAVEKYNTQLFSEDQFITPRPKVDKSGKFFVSANEKEFLYRLKSKSDYEGTVEWFLKKYEENPDGSKQLIQNVYSSLLTSSDENSEIIFNLLRLLGEFEYEEMDPVGVIILSSALSLKGDRVKSLVLDIMGHWPHKDIFNLLKKLEKPASFLAGLKYDAILSSFEKRYPR